MRTILLQGMFFLTFFQACAPQGTEVGNGAKPPADQGVGSGNNRSDGGVDNVTPQGGMPSGTVVGDKVAELLSSTCHSLVTASRPGISVTSYTLSGALPVRSAVGVAEARELKVIAGPAPQMMLGKAELKRGERNQGDLVCVGEESFETTAGEGGISILTLLSRLKYGAIEYSVTIERHKSSTTSSLQRVEIRGPGSFLIEWRN